MKDGFEESHLIDFEQKAIDFVRTELTKVAPTNRRRVIEKFVLAALGSIPWVGGFISAAISYKTEEGSIRTDSLQTQWLEEHARKIEQLMQALQEIAGRFENLGAAIDERIQSEEYLALVRRAFRVWDRADTDDKRKYVGNLISNAAGTRLCSDDVVRLFIDWLDLYHETHFAVIREIYKTPGTTRFLIWDSIYGELPREDSAEADLFRMLIRDLKHWWSYSARTPNECARAVLKKENSETQGTGVYDDGVIIRRDQTLCFDKSRPTIRPLHHE